MNLLHRSPEHEFESSYGLPEALPVGEKILWQGSPNWLSLARHAFHLPALSAYFSLIIAAKLISVALGDVAWVAEMGSIALVIVLSFLGLGLVVYLAYLSAQTTVYTITTQRVVMRVGIVLTVTFNLPFKRIVRADIHAFSDGTGNIPLQLAASDKIAYFHLWPHARPWYFA
ncbi:MAG: photosynthetic complex putative assembly protein PuhB, partial [Burkholderiaceae bacterium]